MRSPAYTATLRREDERARRAAQQIFDRPIVLEAGAGTGKTTTLVARILAWSLGPGWSKAHAALREDAGTASVSDARVAARVLGRVVAITFTEAAAAEMAERAGETFAAVARGELRPGLLDSVLPSDLGERAARACALLGALDHLAVRTIHAWCRGLLARYPLESGIHPDFRVDADMRL